MSADVGEPAPPFDLPALAGGRLQETRSILAEYRGKWLALLFYPRDFSLVCPTELTALGARADEFQRLGCEILGVSVDPVDTHARWVSTSASEGGLGGLAFPLASDGDGAVARAYGVYREEEKAAQRGLFIIDPDGILQYKVVHNHNVARGSDEVLRVLAALQTGGLCGAEWTRGAAQIDPFTILKPGRVVSHYRIEEEIGRGGFAAVYRARDLILERTVALKVLRAKDALSTRAMLAEARSAAALNHPNVCTIYAVDDGAGVPIIAMEFLSGKPLDRLLEGRRLESDEARDVGRQLALGLAAAHAQGVIHGDLKPGNLMVTDARVLKILDFGLARRDARALDPGGTKGEAAARPAGITGTPPYMAPEQALGKGTSPRSDVFSFGLILYELATGKRALAGRSLAEILRGVVELEGSRLAAEVSEPFAGVLQRALVRSAAERSITMEEIARLLS